VRNLDLENILCFVNFDYIWPSVLFEDRKVTQQHTKDIGLNNVKTCGKPLALLVNVSWY